MYSSNTVLSAVISEHNEVDIPSNDHKIRSFFIAVACIATSFTAGAIGSLATIPNIPTWYASLEKPPLLPPNEVFGPVWTALYLLIGISLYLVVKTRSPKNKILAYSAFSAQLVLNTLWSLVFFGLHLPWLGVVVITLLITSILATIYYFRKYSSLAAWLFVPYLAWVCFASYLTISVAILN